MREAVLIVDEVTPRGMSGFDRICERNFCGEMELLSWKTDSMGSCYFISWYFTEGSFAMTEPSGAS